MNGSYTTHSPEETTTLAQQLAALLSPNTILSFYGDLGAGKTTFIKGLVAALTQTPTEEVTSPTFTYLNTYEGATPLYHFDLYRLKTEEEFIHMGFDDYFWNGGITCIEWPQRIPSYIPHNAISITLAHQDPTTRSITIEGLSDG